MRSDRDGRFGHGIALGVVRADHIDDEARRDSAQGIFGVDDVDHRAGGRVNGIQFLRESARPRLVPPADHQLDSWVGRKRTRDIAAEIAVTTDDRDPQRHVTARPVHEYTLTDDVEYIKPKARVY